MLSRNRCKLVLISWDAVQTEELSVSWAEGLERGRAGSLLDMAQGRGTDETGSAQGRGVWVREEKGLPSPSRPQLNCSSFGLGLGSFRTLLPPEVAQWRGCQCAQPGCWCLPSVIWSFWLSLFLHASAQAFSSSTYAIITVLMVVEHTLCSGFRRFSNTVWIGITP